MLKTIKSTTFKAAANPLTLRLVALLPYVKCPLHRLPYAFFSVSTIIHGRKQANQSGLLEIA